MQALGRSGVWSTGRAPGEHYWRRKPQGGVVSSLLTDLIAYWPMTESSTGAGAVTRNDAHTNALHLTDLNTTASAAGLNGNAADFVAANSEALERTNETLIQAGNIDWTWAVWIRPDALDSYVMGKQNSDIDYEIRTYSDGDVELTYYNGAYRQLFLGPGSVSAGSWALLFWWFTQSDQKSRGSVNDGTTKTSGAFASSPPTTTGPLRFGQRSNIAASFFDGRMSHVGFWKRLLTSGERTTFYNAGVPLTYPFS